jgi:S1-C subfamily serine protease
MTNKTILLTIMLAALLPLSGCQVLVTATPGGEPFTVPVIEPPETPPVDPPLGTPDLEGLTEQEKVAVQVYHYNNRGVVNVTAFSSQRGLIGGVTLGEGTGSGSILDQAGHVLTNYHVVRDALGLAVSLYDGSTYPAEMVGFDPENDLALIKFDPNGRRLFTIAMSERRDAAVGQTVFALGNPFGLERTLTTGIISAVGRPLFTPEGFVIRNLIQTDASINPGNSGGPLLDARGEMIGINTMILSPGGGSVGIGFAVPVQTARRIIPDLKEHGRVLRGWIDISAFPVIPVLIRAGDLPVNKGIVVSEVKPGSSAARAGLRGGDPSRRIALGVWGGTSVYLGGDVIVAMNGEPVTNLGEYMGALEETRPGSEILLEVVRGTQRLEIRVLLSERPLPERQ